MLFVPKFKSHSEAVIALECARWRYECADQEYREFSGVFGEDMSPHGKFLLRSVRREYRKLEKTLEGIRRSGYSQVATKYLIIG